MAAGKMYRSKRKPKRKYRSSLARTGVSGSQNPTPFSNTKTVTLKYSDTQVYNPTLGGIVTNIYRLNSCFDPDQTGVGHQPRAFDEYMNLYERYEVLSAKGKVVFSNRDNQYASQCAISVQSGVSTPTLINDYIEGANGTSLLLGQENSNRSIASLSINCNIAKYLGVKAKDPDLQGTSGTSPSQIAYLHVGVQPLQAVTPNGIDVVTDLTMRVKFSHPKKLIQS